MAQSTDIHKHSMQIASMLIGAAKLIVQDAMARPDFSNALMHGVTIRAEHDSEPAEHLTSIAYIARFVERQFPESEVAHKLELRQD